MNDVREVDFNKYCPTCKHAKKFEEDDPCWDCLNEPTNIDSRKPVCWEEDK